ncbi:COP9 signalosome complex subunit 6 [Diplonema papillatum]|nr:COP9 signalosome complex subunit 6 [Diplonema papillatum]
MFVNDTPKYSFNKVSYVIVSEESERISIDNVTHGTGNDSIITPLKMYRGALIMLRSRVAVVKAYLDGVKAGKHQKDHETLREIQALCNRLPTQTSPDFAKAYNEEYDDSLLITYLSTLTRTAVSLAELVETHTSLGKRDPSMSTWY